MVTRKSWIIVVLFRIILKNPSLMFMVLYNIYTYIYILYFDDEISIINRKESRSRWPRGVGVGLLVAGIACSNPLRGMDVCLCVYMFCCPVYVEAFATS
jgi:hypothetical protein